jgi:small-conductance mechanosensitive channel
VRELLARKLFDIGGRPVTVSTIVVVIAIILISALVSRMIRFVLHRSLIKQGVAEGRQLRSLERLLNYVIMVVAAGVALETAGIDLSTVLAASAVFAVGIGLGIQGIAMNFVCGIVLLIERSIKIDDIVEVDGKICRVMDLGIRATRVRTLFEEDIIVPNSVLVQQPIKNLTLHDSLIRISVNVGVAYGSDLEKVRKVLEEVATSMEGVDQSYPPLILLDDLAASSVCYEVSVWVHDPWRHRKYRSKLREMIYDACHREKIVIAFPQMDIHLDGRLHKAA